MEPLNNGQEELERGRGKGGIQWNLRIMDSLGTSFFHCSEVVPSLEVEMYGQYTGRG